MNLRIILILFELFFLILVVSAQKPTIALTFTASSKMGIMIKETSSGHLLAQTSATTTVEWDHKKQKYINPSTLKNASLNVPFLKISHVGQTFQQIDGQMIFSFAYQLEEYQMERENTTTGNQDMETTGESMVIRADFCFDSKSMALITQSATTENPDGTTVSYSTSSTFAKNNLQIIVFTYINWTNPNCNAFNNFCETGTLFETK